MNASTLYPSIISDENFSIKAEYIAETMTVRDLYKLMKINGSNLYRRIPGFDTEYRFVEYLNSPHGLIVLAHQLNEQVDGIHPSSLSGAISTEFGFNIVEPLPDDEFSGERYSAHWMGRKQQGSLVLAGFGRMIDQGDPEAPCLPSGLLTYRMSVYPLPGGPIVALRIYDIVHVIAPLPFLAEYISNKPRLQKRREAYADRQEVLLQAQLQAAHELRDAKLAKRREAYRAKRSVQLSSMAHVKSIGKVAA